MTRSIHDTHRLIETADQYDFSDPAEAEALRQLGWHNIHEQWDIKRGSHHRRNHGRVLPGADVELVPIEVRDEGPFVHHATTEQELRGLMQRLPRGALDGLVAIRMCLGRPLASRNGKPCCSPDPYMGRPGHELLPDIYHASVFGSYFARKQVVNLMAYVRGPDGRRDGLGMFLPKLLTLVTFAHELGHHFDHSFRRAGDRWVRGRTKDFKSKREAFAHRIELLYLRDHILPYLKDSFPVEYRELRRNARALNRIGDSYGEAVLSEILFALPAT